MLIIKDWNWLPGEAKSSTKLYDVILFKWCLNGLFDGIKVNFNSFFLNLKIDLKFNPHRLKKHGSMLKVINLSRAQMPILINVVTFARDIQQTFNVDLSYMCNLSVLAPSFIHGHVHNILQQS